MFPDVCKGGGLCVNTPGSFRCDCPRGLSLDSTGMRCIGQYSSRKRLLNDLFFKIKTSIEVNTENQWHHWGSEPPGCPREIKKNVAEFRKNSGQTDS